MHNKKIFITLLLSGILYASENGVWISDRQKFRNGFENLQLLVEENKFILSKLSFNEERKWEEIRMLGVVSKNEKGEVNLHPEMCSVYSTKTLGARWILIQGFDCDHYEIQVTKNGQGIQISPSIGIENTTLLNESKSPNKNKFQARVISIENETIHAWSLKMRYVKKNAIATINGKKITIIETVDSTGTFVSKEPVKIGDWISIESRESSIFD